MPDYRPTRTDATIDASVGLAPTNQIGGIGPYGGTWPPPLRVVTREGAVALTVSEIIDLVKAGIIEPDKAAELLGF